MFFTARDVLEFLIVKAEWGLGELDVFGGDFDGGGQYAGEVNEEAWGACASDAEEGAGGAFEGTSHYEDSASYHGGGELAGEVVFGIGCVCHCGDEGVHVVVSHSDWFSLCSFCVAVLEGWRCLYLWVKVGFSGADKEEVGDEGYLTACLFAFYCFCDPFEGGEDCEAFVGEELPCVGFGVGSLEVAHGEPL